MDIDMGALRALEREREISLPVLLDAIRSALHAAYLHTDHPVRDSRWIDERTGEVAVIARERDADGVVLEVGRHTGELRPRRRLHRTAGDLPAHPRPGGRCRAR